MRAHRRKTHRVVRATGTVRERDIEEYLVKRVENNGGECMKFVSPARRSVPDRVVLLPQLPGPEFVELKAPKKDATPAQKRMHKRMRAAGAIVHVANSYEAVDALLEKWGCA